MSFSDFIDFNTIHSCLLTATLYMIPLSRRRHFPLRLLGGIVLGILSGPFIILHQHMTTGASITHPSLSFHSFFFIGMKTLDNLGIYIVFLTLLFLFCCTLKLLPSVYCAACVYLTQDLAYTVFVVIMPSAAHRGGQTMKPGTLWIELLIVIIVNIIFYFLLVRNLLIQACQSKNCLFPLLYMLLIIICGRILGTYSRIWMSSRTYNMFRIILVYDILLTLTLLAGQILIFREYHFRRELAMESSLLDSQYQQFLTYQETVSNIRHKCHDLKHLLSALETAGRLPESHPYFQDLKNSILDYDSAINTGNHTLDALLNKTWSSCEQRDIQWTCMADGSSVAFMDPFDLFLMLGNALDNAIECVSSLSDTQKRFLSLQIQKKHQFTLITIKNYCTHTVHFHNGLPETTKSDATEHGYGMKTIQSIAQKYNGNLSAHLDDEIFTLTILLSPEL